MLYPTGKANLNSNPNPNLAGKANSNPNSNLAGKANLNPNPNPKLKLRPSSSAKAYWFSLGALWVNTYNYFKNACI